MAGLASAGMRPQFTPRRMSLQAGIPGELGDNLLKKKKN
jgi:hypothetical protein